MMSADQSGDEARTSAGAEVPRLLQAFDRTPDVIFVTDADDRLCFVSGGVSPLAGLDPADLLGKPLLVLVKHSDHGALLDALDSLRAAEDAPAPVLQIAWKSANRRQTAMVEVVLQGLWLHGQYAGAVGVARDLLLRSEYIDQRLTSERVSAIVELAVATAHKINNPLAILSMQIGVMEQALQDGRPVPQEMLDQMRQVIGRISDVVKDLAAVADVSVQKRLRGRAMMDLGGWAELAEADDDM